MHAPGIYTQTAHKHTEDALLLATRHRTHVNPARSGDEAMVGPSNEISSTCALGVREKGARASEGAQRLSERHLTV
jgi:hypothetical protein